MPESLQEQLVMHLTDVHSIEEQALLQMHVAPRMARDPELARALGQHIAETEEQERYVRGRLEAHGADPAKAKDLIARAGGVGMVLLARSQPDTPASSSLTPTPSRTPRLGAGGVGGKATATALFFDRLGDRPRRAVASSRWATLVR